MGGRPTPFRALRRPALLTGTARHGIAIGTVSVRTGHAPLGFPVPGCLARDHPQLEITGLAAPRLLLTPLSTFPVMELARSGSSFPADSAKPVPLAVVSLDSR